MTDKERLAYAFEKTDSFFKLCTTIRSRRVGRGYRIDSGTEFKHPVTGRAISQSSVWSWSPSAPMRCWFGKARQCLALRI